MRRTISTRDQSPSIVIIQGAYASFCVPAEAPTVYDLSSFANIFAFDEALAVAANQDLWSRFQTLVGAWEQERGAMSSTTEAAMCPAYQSIIGMGTAAVPLIMKQLESEGDDPDQWFWALTAITQAAPEKQADLGNYVKMAASWFDWAKNNGYAW